MAKDFYANVFDEQLADFGGANKNQSTSDPFWSSLFKGVSAGFKAMGSGDGLMRPQPIQELRTGSAPYSKQFDAKSPKGASVADYDRFLSDWESRMYQFTRSKRILGSE